MARISTYPLDSVIQAKDKFIGTDVSGTTTNFSVESLIDFMNKSATLQGNSSARFKYVNTWTGARPSGAITFESNQGETVPFEDIEIIVISRYNVNGDDFRQYYPAIVSGRIIVQKAADVSQFAVYDVTSQEVFAENNEFNLLRLAYVTGNGDLENEEDYFVFLLQYGADTNDKNFVFTQSTVSEKWEITHDLNKYPSVDIVDSGGNKIFAEVKYLDLNSLEINFGHSTSGKAYMN